METCILGLYRYYVESYIIYNIGKLYIIYNDLGVYISSEKNDTKRDVQSSQDSECSVAPNSQCTGVYPLIFHLLDAFLG